MPIKTIVVGTDLGESGHRAMRLAIATARATHATLWLVHASEMGLEHSWSDLPVGARSAAQALRERLKGRFENSLQELERERKACEDLGLSCQTSCEEGRPWETILRTAVSVNADLIAVGDPVGAIGLPERLLGSTAERVVRQAPCSVLVSCGRLRADYSGARIAVGVDFSAHGVEAVRWARDVANAIEGEVSLLHVVPHPITESRLPTEWPSVLEGLASMARSRLIFTAASARSRIIDSTSRPTYPTSVNFVASTFIKGASARRARRLAISVLPTPVGPIMRMFFGVISYLKSAST